MKARILAKEALAGLLGRRVLTSVMVGLLAALILMVGLSDSVAFDQARDRDRALVASGYATAQVIAETPAALSEADCTGAGGIPGVLGHAAFGEPLSWHLWSEDGPPLNVRATSTSAAAALAASGYPIQRPESVVVLDAAPAMPRTGKLWISDGLGVHRLVPAGSAQLSVLGPAFDGGAIWLTHEVTQVSHCAVLVAEDHREAVAGALRQLFPASDGFAVRWALVSADSLLSPRAQFEHGVGRQLWLAVGLAWVVVLLLYLRLRRPDLALLRVCGVPTRLMALSIGVELSVICLASMALAFSASLGLLGLGWIDLQSQIIGWLGALGACAIILGAVPILAVERGQAVAESALDTLKDR
jgi:hypothetical protein